MAVVTAACTCRGAAYRPTVRHGHFRVALSGSAAAVQREPISEALQRACRVHRQLDAVAHTLHATVGEDVDLIFSRHMLQA